MNKLPKTIKVLLISFLLFSCHKTDDFVQQNNTNIVFERDFISFNYSANPTDNSKIDIRTVIDVELDAADLYPNGLYLVVTQNFRHRNSFRTFSPSTHIDTLFILNDTNRSYTLNDEINYINASYIIENPEVIIHDRSFSFYRP